MDEKVEGQREERKGRGREVGLIRGSPTHLISPIVRSGSSITICVRSIGGLVCLFATASINLLRYA